MREERLWHLLSLKLSDESSQEENAEFELLMIEYPHLALKAHMMQSLWASSHKQISANEQDASFNRHMQRLNAQLSEPTLKYELPPALPIEAEEVKSKLRIMRKTLAWVAAVAIIIIIVWKVYLNLFL